MKKGLIKAAVLTMVFILTLFLSGKIMNINRLDLTTEMAEVTLPVVVLYNEDTPINELHGYTAQMNAVGMRGTITPLSESREIPLLIRPYGYRIDSIAYEIRSIDGGRLISDGSIDGYKERDEQIRTSIPVQSLLEQEREYILTLKLKQNETTCYYYTRIADAQDCYVPESIQFVKKINELTFSKNTDELSAYWEPNQTGDNTSLHKVTINSSLSQAGWANFTCSMLTDPIPALMEMNSSYNVILLNYVVTANSSAGELEYYNVEEYYRIRYTSERIYLLNFERTMNQIFSGENNFRNENYLHLGIRAKEVEYRKNETGTVTCFVQEGDLWSYNQASGRLAEVFSFRRHEGIDARENDKQHDIRILNIDEAGNIDYAVYGYMNRGVHEGRVGVSFLHYDSQTNTNEEKVFMAFDKSYEMLKAELGNLLYQNAAGSVYLLFNGTIYHTNTETMELEETATGLKGGMYAASDTNRYFAWISDNGSQEITVMDLETGSTQKISAKKGKTLRVLGFLQEDLVYGIAADKHQMKSPAGIGQAPMYALRIVNAENAQTLKEYKKSGYYIDSVEFSGSVLAIQRLTAGENGYVPARQDSIVNRTAQEDKKDAVRMIVTEKKQQQIQLALAQMGQETSSAYVAAKQVKHEDDRELSLKTETDAQNYFAYAKGKLQVVSVNIAEAIRYADKYMGVVVDAQQNYIWKRGRKIAQPALEVQPSEIEAEGTPTAKCISAMLKNESIEVSVSALLEKGDTPQEILQSLLSERKVVQIAGCGIEQIFYYISCGMPVLAAGSTQNAVLAVGYDTLNVWFYDPQAGGIIRKTIEEARLEFDGSGSVYVTCLPDETQD